MAARGSDEPADIATDLEHFEVIAVRYNGLIHDWGLLNPIATVPEVRTAIAQVAAELKKRLT